MHRNASIREITRLWLEKSHAVGLVNPGVCGCGLDDLMPCGSDCVNVNECVAAYCKRGDCYYTDIWALLEADEDAE